GPRINRVALRYKTSHGASALVVGTIPSRGHEQTVF
ncbi:MAG: hypothetical protein JWO48_1645, partial [Bryobacterales bacterium]|nr:hypothetical protein [Bryobacterales bacterium]